MKRVLLVLVAATLAVPLWSDEVKKEQPRPAKPAESAPATTTISTTTSSSGDSIFVQAARRANRKGKKPTNVITNDTLSKSGGKSHITTTASQYAVSIPEVEPTAEMKARVVQAEAKKAADEKAAAERKKAEARQERMNQTAATEDEDLFNGENPEEIAPADQGPGSQNEQRPPQR